MKETKPISVGVVILSRFSSTRLPGKALITIEGKPILSYIIERVSHVFNSQEIILATSEDDTDEPIVEYSQKNGIRCFRGSLLNVAERFYMAAASQNWEYALRINGDNIFVDIPLLKLVKKRAEGGDKLFISNVKNRTFPKGMSIEAVQVNHYRSLLVEINKSAQYQEHVTLFLYHNELQGYDFIMNDEFPELAGMQLALDTKEDLERTKKIITSFKGPHESINLQELKACLNILSK